MRGRLLSNRRTFIKYFCFALNITVVVEKLLRATDVKRIYFLVRTKRGEKMEARFESWKKDQVSADPPNL